MTGETALNFKQRAEKQDNFFRDLIADPDTDFGLDPSWVSIYPYQMIVLPGQEKRIEIRVQNYRPRELKLK